MECAAKLQSLFETAMTDFTEQLLCSHMRKKYFYDVEFLDYVNWKVPNSCRMDAHHLNGKGAILFTNELKNRFHLR